MSPPSTNAPLATQNWAELRELVRKYALRRCGGDEALAKDLAQAAITRVLSPDSAWDREKEPSLERHLLSIVNSLAFNERHRARSRDVSLSDDDDSSLAEGLADPRARPDAKVIAADLLARRFALAEARLADDPEGLQVLAFMSDGHVEVSDLQPQTGWPTDKVIRVRKRVMRHVVQVADELDNRRDATKIQETN